MTRRQHDIAAARRYWRAAAVRGGCVMCRAYPVQETVAWGREGLLGRIEAHHIVPASALRAAGLDGHLNDERNGIGLCAFHHARHTTFHQRLPRHLLPDLAHEFAHEVGMTCRLDREYPAP